jgi:hypothetical protein
VLSEENGKNADGTNTVQRADPNMAGSKVTGVKSGKRSIDEDKEIRKGTSQQQSAPEQSRPVREPRENSDNSNSQSEQQTDSRDVSKIYGAEESGTAGESTKQKRTTGKKRSGNGRGENQSENQGVNETDNGGEENPNMTTQETGPAMDTGGEAVIEDFTKTKKEKRKERRRNRREKN